MKLPIQTHEVDQPPLRAGLPPARTGSRQADGRGRMTTSAATSPTIDVSSLLAEEEKRRFATDQALGLEVYEFLYKAVAEECSKKQVLGGDRCGKCLVCQAKVLEEKLRIRHVQLGWKLEACKSCKGTGVQKFKEPKR